MCSCSVLFTSCCVAVAFDLRLVLSAKLRQFTVSCSERCGGKNEVAADSTRGRCGNGNRLLRYLVIRRLGPGREDVCIRAPSVVHKAYIPQVSRKDGVGRHSPRTSSGTRSRPFHGGGRAGVPRGDAVRGCAGGGAGGGHGELDVPGVSGRRGGDGGGEARAGVRRVCGPGGV